MSISDWYFSCKADIFLTPYYFSVTSLFTGLPLASIAAFNRSLTFPLGTVPRRVAGVVVVSTVTSLNPAFFNASSILALSPESLAAGMVVVGKGVGLVFTGLLAVLVAGAQLPHPFKSNGETRPR